MSYSRKILGFINISIFLLSFICCTSVEKGPCTEKKKSCQENIEIRVSSFVYDIKELNCNYGNLAENPILISKVDIILNGVDTIIVPVFDCFYQISSIGIKFDSLEHWCYYNNELFGIDSAIISCDTSLFISLPYHYKSADSFMFCFKYYKNNASQIFSECSNYVILENGFKIIDTIN